MKYNRDNRGFTLVELLTVIVIIALLSGIMLTNMSASKGKGRDAQRVTDVHQLQLALALYFDRCGQYPTSLVTTTSNGCPSGTNLGTFISQIPTPPGGTPQTSYSVGYYTRYPSSTSVNYVLVAVLETMNAAMNKGLDASQIPNPTGAWSLQANQPPFSYCSKTVKAPTGYYYYCISPN